MSSTTGASPTVEESVGGGEDAGVPRVWDAVGALVGAFGQGRVVARETARSGQELAKITVGRSEVAPAKGDRRLSDPAWTANPLYHRAGQSYLASAEAIGGVVGAWARTADHHRRAYEASFAASILTSALAPTNYLPTSPAATKEVFDTAGMSLVRGVRPSERAEQLRRARRQAATSTPRSTLPQGCMRGTCLPRSFPRRSRPD